MNGTLPPPGQPYVWEIHGPLWAVQDTVGSDWGLDSYWCNAAAQYAVEMGQPDRIPCAVVGVPIEHLSSASIRRLIRTNEPAQGRVVEWIGAKGTVEKGNTKDHDSGAMSHIDYTSTFMNAGHSMLAWMTKRWSAPRASPGAPQRQTRHSCVAPAAPPRPVRQVPLVAKHSRQDQLGSLPRAHGADVPRDPRVGKLCREYNIPDRSIVQGIRLGCVHARNRRAHSQTRDRAPCVLRPWR